MDRASKLHIKPVFLRVVDLWNKRGWEAATDVVRIRTKSWGKNYSYHYQGQIAVRKMSNKLSTNGIFNTYIWGNHIGLWLEVWNNTKQRNLCDSEAVDTEEKASGLDRIHSWGSCVFVFVFFLSQCSGPGSWLSVDYLNNTLQYIQECKIIFCWLQQ